MCKLSKFFSFYFIFSLFSGCYITNASQNIKASDACISEINNNVSNKKVEINTKKSNEKDKDIRDKQNKNKKMESINDKETKQLDISSLPEEILGLIKDSCEGIFKDFFSSIVEFKKKSTDKNIKKIIKFLGDCKFTFENNQGLIIKVYPKSVCNKKYTLENIANLKIGSNYKVKFYLAKISSHSEEKESFDISSLSEQEIKKMFRPYLNDIKSILVDILDFKSMFSDYKDIADFLSSCKFSFEKYRSSKKSIFKFNIYPDDFIEDETANVKTILDIDLDKSHSVKFNLVKKSKVIENVKS